MVCPQKLLELLLPGADPRQGLTGSLVAEFRLIRPKDLPNCVPRHMQFARNLPQRPALDVEGPPDPRNPIHPLHPLLRLPTRNRRSDEIQRGAKFARRNTRREHRVQPAFRTCLEQNLLAGRDRPSLRPPLR